MIDLSVDVVREFKEYRLEKVCGDTIRKEMSLMKRMVDYAMKEWNIYLPKGNPFCRVSLPSKGAARERRLNSGEFERILEESRAYGDDLPILFELAIETAMRRGELISLEWRNVDLQRRTAHLPDTKNGSSRTVPLSARAVELIQQIVRQGDH